MAASRDSKAKRSEFRTFLNIGTVEDPKWVLEGKYASDMTIQMNPQTSTSQDVTQDTAETDITGYQPSMPVSKSVSKTDPAYDYINDIYRHRKILSDAYGQILNVDIFDKQDDGSYPAELQDVSIQIDTRGGSAADPLTIAYTYNYRGDATIGKATITDGKVTFTPADDTPVSEINLSKTPPDDEN